MEVIGHIELTSTTAGIVFSDIPQTYKDLYLVASIRNTRSATGAEARVYFNGGSDFTTRYLGNETGTIGSGVITARGFCGVENGATSNANTFSNSWLYVPNYTSSTPHVFSAESQAETNTTGGVSNYIVSGLWNTSAAITSIELNGSFTYSAGSSATLYGISAGSDGTTTVS